MLGWEGGEECCGYGIVCAHRGLTAIEWEEIGECVRGWDGRKGGEDVV